ncbi:MAG: TetR/AcrR family transcriptional regulator [Devosia sp.]
MGRTRTFDRTAVLGAAMHLFRQRGYRDVSIGDLEKATGLVSGSIYNAFGDKAGLFRAALDFYVHDYVAGRLQTLAGATARLEDLEQLLLSVLEEPMADGHGCLVNNSIVEFGASGGIAGDGVNASLDLVRTAISGVLARELPDASATDTMTLLLLYHGSLTLSRSTTAFAEMADAVRAQFTTLRQRRDTIGD